VSIAAAVQQQAEVIAEINRSANNVADATTSLDASVSASATAADSARHAPAAVRAHRAWRLEGPDPHRHRAAAGAGWP
jgi:hypothetical protein